eukprot:gene10290-11350_t
MVHYLVHRTVLLGTSFGSSERDVGYYVGIIASALYIGRILSSYFWGWLCDRIGRRTSLIITTIMLLFTTCAFGVSRSMAWAFTTRFLQGLVGGVIVALKACVFGLCDETNSSLGMAFLLGGFSVGIITGPALGGFLAFPTEKFPAVFAKGSRYLGCQGQAIRGNNEKDSNLIALLQERKNDVPELAAWPKGDEKYKWLSHDVSNEILQDFSKAVLRELVKKVKDVDYFGIMLDETSDGSNKEQIDFCFRIVDEDFNIEEPFFSFYATEITSSEKIFTIMKDVLAFSSNYGAILHWLQEVDEHEKNTAGVKAGGYLRSLTKFGTFFSIEILRIVFTVIEGGSASLQATQLNFMKAEKVISAIRQSISDARIDARFPILWQAIETSADLNESIDEPQLPTQRKVPRRLDDNAQSAFVPQTAKDAHRQLYFSLLDSVFFGLTDRFEPNETAIHFRKIESFILGREISPDYISQHYVDDLDCVRLLP